MMAADLTRRWAWRQDRALVDDVEMAGWEAVCRGKDPLPAMRDEITRWLWGVTCGQAPRCLTYACALDAAVGVQDDSAAWPDRAAEARIEVERLWAEAPADERAVWGLCAAYGRQVPRREYRHLGWNSNMFFDRRRALRRRARSIISGVPAARPRHFRRRARVAQTPDFGALTLGLQA